MTAITPPTSAPERVPSVLVVLVVRDAAGWLRECLQALASQTYPKVGVLAIDDGSMDGSYELLAHALGEGRVIRHSAPRGRSRSFAEAAALPVAEGADFLLLLHDDVVLDPDTVTRLVEATQLRGVDRVGLVGAKVVDWEQPRRLRDVGRSADRFGHPYSSLQQDEIDQGQFDRVLDVLVVDQCALLVARDVWRTLGLFDERLGDDEADVDLCWRVRLAGWHVLMTPLARVRHLAREREDAGGDRSRRFEEDRAALAAVLKNYGLLSLLWIVPLGIVLTLFRLVFLVLSRRFEEGYELLAAVGWNIAHLPGTLARRRRVQKARRSTDRSMRRFMESAGLRLPRWFQTAERILEEQLELEEQEAGEPVTARLRHHTASLVSSHPVAVASFMGVVVGILTVRHLFGPEVLFGGSMPSFPGAPGGYLSEFVSAYRSTGLGGSLPASPAVAAVGGLSAVLLDSSALVQKALLIGLPALAVILCYRAAVRLTGQPGPAVVSAACLGLSALVLWSLSEGRIASLAGLAALPALTERLERAFHQDPPQDGGWRFAAGVGVTIAAGAAFAPGILLAFALMLAVQVVAGRSRLRGLALALVATVVAAVLLFPFVPTLVAGGGRGLGSWIGTDDPSFLVRLAPGGGAGTWPVALFLPVASIVALALCRGERRAPANRLALVSVVSLALAWASAAGYLPHAVSNTEVYLGLTAVSQALLVGFGLASVSGGLEREAFGFRQIGTALLTFALAVGLTLQSIAATTSTWAIGGKERIPAAWAVIDSADTGTFRVLWVGRDDGRAFPAPGGDPQGVVEAGEATLRYGLTDREGMSAVDIARPLAGPGASALERAISEILSGGTVHGGALLARFGIRYVVANADEMPEAARTIFDSQADLDLVHAAGLVIYRNAVELPPAAVIHANDATREIIASDRIEDALRLSDVTSVALTPTEGGFRGSTAGGNVALLSVEFDGAWQLEDPATGSEAARAFGWATSFDVEGAATVRIRYADQLPRTIGAWLLALLWLVALWVTRRPVAR